MQHFTLSYIDIKMKPSPLFYLLLPLLGFSETKTWNSFLPGSSWNFANHWTNSGIPGPLDTVVFGEIPTLARDQLTVTLIAPSQIGSLEFDNPNASTGYFLTSVHAIKLIPSSEKTSISSSARTKSTNIISAPLILGKDLEIFHQSSQKMIFEKPISGLEKNIDIFASHGGVVEFSGPEHNTFSGKLTLHEGTLLLNKKPGIISIPGNLTLLSGLVKYGSDRQLTKTSVISLVGSHGDATLDFGNNRELIDSLHLSETSFVNKVLLHGNVTLQGGRPDSLLLSNKSIVEGSGTLFFDKPNTGLTSFGGKISPNMDLGGEKRSFTTLESSLVIEGVISHGSLVKEGPGTLVLNGVNTYLGGTFIQDGTLIGSTTSVKGPITNHGRLVFSQGFNDHFSPMIQGDGAIVKTGIGTLSLEGDNLFTGEMFLQEGALTLAHSSALGTSHLTMSNETILHITPGIIIENPVYLEGEKGYLDIPEGDALLLGNLTGGSFEKTGLGNLDIQGKSSLQGFLVNEGTLVLNGTLSTETPLEIHSKASLQGTGILNGNLLIQGTLSAGTENEIKLPTDPFIILDYFSFEKDPEEAPPLSQDIYLVGEELSLKTSSGEISIIGDMTLPKEATISLPFDPNSHGVIHVKGALHLDSPTLTLLPGEGIYHLNHSYTIAMADEIYGNIGEIHNRFPLIKASTFYEYHETQVFLSLQLSRRNFAELFSKGNAGQVAKILDTFAITPCQNSSLIIDAITNLTQESQIENALLQLQPSFLTSLSVAQENDLIYLRNAIYARLQEDQTSCKFKEQKKKVSVKNKDFQEILFPDTRNDHGIRIWGSCFGGFTNQASEKGEPGYAATSPGAMLSGDKTFGDNAILGGSLGYIYTEQKWKKERGQSHSQNGYASIYGQYSRHWGYVMADASLGYSSYKLVRPIAFGPLNAIHTAAHSQFQGVEGALHLKSGLYFPFQTFSLSPFAGLSYMIVHTADAKERNARSLNLKIKSHNGDLLTSEGGLDLSFCEQKDAVLLKAFVRPSLIVESRFFGSSEECSFTCGGSMNVQGLYPSRVLAGLGAGLNTYFGKNVISLSYQAKVGSSFQDQSLFAEYLWKF